MKTKQIVRFLLALLVLIPVVAVSFLSAPAASAAQPLPGSAKAVRSGNVGTFDAEYGAVFEYRPLMPLGEEAEVTYVAEVNGTQYTTLAEAVETATVGQTITLLTNLNDTDIATTDYYVYDLTGKTLDLGGFTYTSYNFTRIFEGSDVTIKNGKMVCANGGPYALFIGDEGTTDGFVVDSVELTGGINIYNASNVVLKNLKVEGKKFYAVWLD